MEFRQFRYLLKVAQCGSISKAAQELYVSQPSLSQLISGVEKKVGAPLFDRTASPLRPTSIGQLYLATAQQILNLDTEFHQQIDDLLHLKRGHLRLGTTPFRSAYLLAPFLPSFQQTYPEIAVQLVENTTRQLEAMALHGEVDLIITLSPVTEKHFVSQLLFTEELVLALPPTHPLAQKYHLPQAIVPNLPVLPLASLQDTPFIQMHSEQKLSAQLSQLCQQAGFLPQIAMTTSSMETAQALAGAGLGATILPVTQAEGFTPALRPCYAALAAHPQREVLLAWRRNRYLSNAARAFCHELSIFCQRKKIERATFARPSQN